jgi:hypothetical protein
LFLGNEQNAEDTMTYNLTIKNTVTSLGLGAGMLLAASGNVHADEFQLQNRTNSPVSIAVAETDDACPAGLRDLAWFNLGPNASQDLQLNTSGLFLIGGVRTDRAQLEFLSPESNRDQQNFWSPSFEGSSNLACSAVSPNDPDNDPNAGIWHSRWNLSGGCAEGILGAIVFDQVPGDDRVLGINVTCFVNGPSTPAPIPGPPGPGPV